MKRRMDISEQRVSRNEASAYPTGTAMWLGLVLTVTSVNSLFVVAMLSVRAGVLAGWPVGVKVMVEALGHRVYKLAFNYVPLGLKAPFESLLGAESQVIVVVAAAGIAACVLLPFLIALNSARKQRTRRTAQQRSGVGSTDGNVFCRRTFLLLCVLGASELAGLACVNWAAAYAAAVMLVPLCILGDRLL